MIAKISISKTMLLRAGIFLLGMCLVGVMVVYGTYPQEVEAAPAGQPNFQISFVGSPPVYTVTEGGTANITVRIDPAITTTITATVQYLTSDGTGRAGVDYISASGTLIFNSSNQVRTFPIQTIDNTTNDGNRTVILTINNATNATVANSPATLVISDNDPPPTNTPAGGTPVFADVLEPNNSFNEASDIAPGAAARCNLTFFPPGDEDYFRWWAKAGITYIISTSNLASGLDTTMNVYDVNRNQIASNDDIAPGIFASQVRITANTTGFYYARVTNKTPVDPVNRTYCFEVAQVVQNTPTPPPGFPPGADACEFNSTIETACLIVPNETLSLSFVPTLGSHQDTDMFRIWVKPGIYTTCDTEIPTGSAADTNMILRDAHGNPFNPWIGNDDKEPGNFGSQVSYLATYTGWLFIEAGPVSIPPIEEAAAWTYTLTCVQTVATPTPTATATFVRPPTTGTGGTGGGFFPTATPAPTFEFPTPFPTPTPIDIDALLGSRTPPPPPIVDVQPLPTVTPAAGGAVNATIRVTVYYDANNNFLPELNEGIVNAAVSLTDNSTGQLLSFGHTNEAGVVQFTNVNSIGAIRVDVPFLNHSQIVSGGSSEILIRVAPLPLPNQIP